MKRYDIDIEDLGGLAVPHMDISEQPDGEWVRWEDVKEAINSSSPRRYIECNHSWTRVGALKVGYQWCRNCGAREQDKAD